MKSSHFDIIILGAGPAGSSCALALKDSGLNIALVDKSSFPRDKICGDSVSSVAKRLLRTIDPELEQRLLMYERKSYIRKAIVHSPRFERLPIQFRTVSHCIRRTDFDQWLFNVAIEKCPTLVVKTGTAVNKVERSDSRIMISMENGETLTTQLLIACDGAQSIVAKTFAGYKIDRMHYSGAVRQYYKNVKGLNDDTSEVYLLKDYLPGYFWIFPLSGNEANVGFGMLSSTIAKRKIDLKKSLISIIQDNSEVSERFKDAEPLDDIKGFGLPLGSQKRALSGDGYMLCGDAASLIDPLSGEGIAQAMESGIIAANQAVQCFSQKQFNADFMKNYDRNIHSRFWKPFRNHHFIQRALGNRVWLINSLISLLNVTYLNRRIAKWL